MRITRAEKTIPPFYPWIAGSCPGCCFVDMLQKVVGVVFKNQLLDDKSGTGIILEPK
jgi:hypothetical protein